MVAAVAVILAVIATRNGGDGWESNPPRTPQQRPATGFEDRGRHQPPYIPQRNGRGGRGAALGANAGTRASRARGKGVIAGTRRCRADLASDRWGDQRFELGLQVALHVRAVADGSLRGLAV